MKVRINVWKRNKKAYDFYAKLESVYNLSKQKSYFIFPHELWGKLNHGLTYPESIKAGHLNGQRVGRAVCLRAERFGDRLLSRHGLKTETLPHS